MNNLQLYRLHLNKLQGKKEGIEQDIEKNERDIKKLKYQARNHEQALQIIKEVGLKTQQKLQFHISNITSLALESVFDNPYTLKVEFVERKDKTECLLTFERDGNEIDPIKDSGVGAVDVAAFALRVASWSMQMKKTRNVLILDEPFKHLKGETENLRVLQMIREISSKLGIQIIMVSDERISKEDIIDNADKVFEVSIRNGISSVK